ncbi:hypothetical protein [Hyella patelloides]|nr:hypothetical protein [Hyella patelloides]
MDIERIINNFWLLAIASNIINAIVFWIRAQPHIKKKPELRSGYIKLIRGFFIGFNIPWFLMGIGMTTGFASDSADYLNPRGGNPFVIIWWVTLWSLIALLSRWIWFKSGAEKLIKYPGFIRGQTNAQRIKLIWLLSLIGAVIGSTVTLFIEVL